MHEFKSAILGELKTTKILNLCMKFKKKIRPKDFFWSIVKVPYPKNIQNLSQGLSNPGFRSVKVQTEDFLKKDSQHFKNHFQFGFLWIPRKPGKQNWKVPFLLIFIIVNNNEMVKKLDKVVDVSQRQSQSYWFHSTTKNMFCNYWTCRILRYKYFLVSTKSIDG